MLRYSKLSTGEDKVTKNNKSPMENRKLLKIISVASGRRENIDHTRGGAATDDSVSSRCLDTGIEQTGSAEIFNFLIASI